MTLTVNDKSSNNKDKHKISKILKLTKKQWKSRGKVAEKSWKSGSELVEN